MVKILLSGCCGFMGRTVTEIIQSKNDIEIKAGVDLKECDELSYPVFASFNEVNIDTDVIIDFSNPSNLNSLLNYAVKNHIPAVLCTTGYNNEQIALINEAGKKTAIFRSANMSIGINLISELCKKAAEVLGDDFDVEIVEAHHNLKLDAPSGTALMLEKSIEEGLNYQPDIVYDRHSKREKRNKHEIGIHSIRGGNIVGEHEVMFAGNNEIIKISHSARSKSVFAIGAVNAAKFIRNKSNGIYSMTDLLNEII